MGDTERAILAAIAAELEGRSDLADPVLDDIELTDDAVTFYADGTPYKLTIEQDEF